VEPETFLDLKPFGSFGRTGRGISNLGYLSILVAPQIEATVADMQAQFDFVQAMEAVGRGSQFH
jgi:hypothetical protein